MQIDPIIKSLLETDQYKFNMQNIVAKKFSDYTCVWTFRCRNDDVRFTPDMVCEIREQIDHYCNLTFKADELEYLRKTLPWLGNGYVNFLKFWHPVRSDILVNEGNVQFYGDCGLAIEARGTWLDTMMYEIAILAIVNEVYFAFKYGYGALDVKFQRRTMEKFAKVYDESFAYGKEFDDEQDRVDFLKKYGYEHTYVIGTFSEFGMRRRLSSAMHDWLVNFIVDSKVPGFVGTSNVYLARKYGVKPVGTMAHEMIMAIGQGNHMLNPAYSNAAAMREWTDEYGTKNGIMLGDTITTDCFLRDFTDKYANLFCGVRHDSGNPIEWGNKILNHYMKLGIDPHTKTLLFSDSLDFYQATRIRRCFASQCNVAFGIGTYLTNDAGVEPLNVVMKLTEVNGSPVAKLSDCDGKGMCRDSRYVDYLRRSIEWRMTHE